MKKISSIVLAVSLATVAFVGCGSKSTAYKATAEGFGGDVTVEVKVSKDGELEAVNVDASSETPDIGGAAADEIVKAIAESKSLSVDTVTGATVTSEAVIKAAGDALAEAGVELN